YWTEQHAKDAASLPWIGDSVLPIVEAKRAEVIKSNHRLDDLVELLPTPGHTIDHYSVRVGKPDADAVITGDMIHSPLQARYPELGIGADSDTARAGRTRGQFSQPLADPPPLGCVVHSPAPSAGRLARWGEGFRFLAP